MSLKAVFFVNTLFSVNKKKEPIIQTKGDKKISGHLDEFFRNNENSVKEVVEILLTDCDLSGFLNSVRVVQRVSLDQVLQPAVHQLGRQQSFQVGHCLHLPHAPQTRPFP